MLECRSLEKSTELIVRAARKPPICRFGTVSRRGLRYPKELAQLTLCAERLLGYGRSKPPEYRVQYEQFR